MASGGRKPLGQSLVDLDEVKLATGLEVEVVVSPEPHIREAVDRYHPLGGGLELLVREQGQKQGRPGEDLVTRAEEDGPVIRFVNAVVHQAVREGASDLHFEPDESNLRIRYRVDGILREASIQSKSIHASVVSRVKIMAQDRKSTRLNSSHSQISYAVFCLKKKKN